MEATAYIVPGQLAYLELPSSGLRHYVDNLFPYFAKFPIADSVSGWGHRYAAGHDLLLDVPATLAKHGPVDSFKHLGHIVLTDFPTKAGVPIPGFSASGLGGWLEGVGIPRGWMSVNICDTGIGIFAVSESHPDLVNAIGGNLDMNAAVFFDTFVEGAVEVTMAVSLQNPFLLYAGVENFLAGVISAWQTVSVYVDPITFFGASFTSAFVGFVVANGILNQSSPESVKSAIRAGTVGALFAVSPSFGFGAIGGLLTIAAGRALAQKHARSNSEILSVDRESVSRFVAELMDGMPEFSNVLRAAERTEVYVTTCEVLDVSGKELDCQYIRLPEDVRVLSSAYQTLSSAMKDGSLDTRQVKFQDGDDYPLLDDSDVSL